MWLPVPITSELCSTACVLTRCLTSCVCLAKWIFTYLMSALSGLTDSSTVGAHTHTQKKPTLLFTSRSSVPLFIWYCGEGLPGWMGDDFGSEGGEGLWWWEICGVGGWAEEDEGRRIQQPTPGLWSMKGARQKNSSCSALGQDPPDCSFS